jgi:VIT1/CCC1 family predicted Fe2+/Mn2+ transporter
LRAAVLGADDGIVSTASLIVGVAASNAPHAHIVVSGMAGLVAGAMSMAAGEYVSVHSQADSERSEPAIPGQLRARPIQAALASAASFAVGAALPLGVTALGPQSMLIPLVFGGSLASLAILGAVAARAGGAPMAPGAARVAFWGALAMVVTAGVGLLFGGQTP